MSPQVDRCELAPGLSVSRIITGLWQIADMERAGDLLDRKATASAMGTYVDMGLTSFDMADHYGSAEEIAGHFAKGRNDVQLLTKWVPEPGPLTEKDVRAGVKRALKRMNRDTIDLIQFHAWSYTDPSWLDALFYLDELKKEGVIHHIGLTNFDVAHLRMAVHSGIEIVSNQVCFSLLDQRPSAAMFDFCQQNNIKLLAYGTLAGGFLSERWLDSPEPELDTLNTWSQMKYRRFIDVAGGWDKFQNLLQTLNTVASLTESEHVKDNLRLFEFSLDQESQSEIEVAIAKLTPIHGDCGDEYRKPPFLTASGDLSHHIETIPPPYETRHRAGGKTVALSGTVWETMAGYSRAVRQGDKIWVSGTTASHGSRLIGGSDPVSQTHFIIDKIEGAIQSLGGALAQVVRTRIFVSSLDLWEAVARTHGERFKEILPANTLVQASLVGEEYLVEMEAEAVVVSNKSSSIPGVE